MNKNAIKNYAIWARNELITRVTQKAFEYGVSKDTIVDFNADSINGKLLSNDEKKQRQQFISDINYKGFDQVIEEVAYTWFNRFIALRYMEVNNYLPNKIRVFTNENNEFKPQILDEALNIDFYGLDKELIFELMDKNEKEELYKQLLIATCNNMGNYLPGMFTKIEDYKVLLFPDNILKEENVVGRLIKDVDEEDWDNQVQIIGWMYQYYNIEEFNRIFDGDMSKKNVEKNMLPAATELFTPHWVVQSMVDNSLGKLWVDCNDDLGLKNKWKYNISNEKIINTKEIDIQSIKFLDPCMGSGHILVYAFDMFMDIYISKGWDSRSAVESILAHNIFGLDIDERAYQLSYFSLMMKARAYSRRILTKRIIPNIYCIKESNQITDELIEFIAEDNLDVIENLKNLRTMFYDAKIYGSAITKVDINTIIIEDQLKTLTYNGLFEISYEEDIRKYLVPLLEQYKLFNKVYDVVVTNPPYLGSGRYTNQMTNYVKKHHDIAKQDLSTVIIKNIIETFSKKDGLISLVTTISWMYIQRFASFREYVLHNCGFVSLIDYGTELFDGKIGHLPIASYTLINSSQNHHNFNAIRLVDYCYSDRDKKEREYFNNNNYYISNQRRYENIPNKPIAYWCSQRMADSFSYKKIGDYVNSKAGIVTGNDPYFLRLWYEIDFTDFTERGTVPYGKYHIMQKGGQCQYFYGNYDYLIKLKDLYDETKVNKSVRRGDKEYYFKKCIGWSQVGNNSNKSFRLIENSVCGTATPSIYPIDNSVLLYLLGFLNTSLSKMYLDILNPTINLLTTDVCNIPLIVDNNRIKEIDQLVMQLLSICKKDWDDMELSWNFKGNKLVEENRLLKDVFDEKKKMDLQNEKTYKLLMEKLNKTFSEIYEISDFDLMVYEKDMSLHHKVLRDMMIDLISYAVGCMFGRYALDAKGLIYAGGEWDNSKYKRFIPDEDNIIPICDDEYFEDDIIGRFIEFVKVVYGEDTLEENLKFIADALGGKGTPREVLRSYFLNDFFKDHCNTYQVTGSGKRPIYWLFDSGKKNGFKALIYIHRYTPDLIARMRTQYIHEQQARYRNQIEMLERQIDEDISTSERVRLNKQLKKFKEQDEELRKYEEKIHHWADRMEPMDLDDGVKANYAKFQPLLAKIK